MIEYYTVPEVLRILNIPEPTFQTCLKAALFRTGRRTRPRRFSFHDLIVLRTAKGLSEAGIPATKIRRVLRLLKEQLPEGKPLGNARVYADGERVIVVSEGHRWRPESGQFLFNFEAHEGDLRKLRNQAGTEKSQSGRDWFERALQFEEKALAHEATDAYDKALELDPSLVDAHINVGCLHHHQGALGRAEHHYREAIRYAPNEVLGYFNLAVLLEDRGDRLGAIESYKQVLELQPNYPDAHHNIARLYE
ncbi:MAG: tetratricopeptide repeat protein, partial [Nitrospiraceae bacterium]